MEDVDLGREVADPDGDEHDGGDRRHAAAVPEGVMSDRGVVALLGK